MIKGLYLPAESGGRPRWGTRSLSALGPSGPSTESWSLRATPRTTLASGAGQARQEGYPPDPGGGSEDAHHLRRHCSDLQALFHLLHLASP